MNVMNRVKNANYLQGHFNALLEWLYSKNNSALELAFYDSFVRNYLHIIGEEKTNIKTKVGQIVLVDFGALNYNREVWYIHVGIILKKCGGKLLVAPLSSNIQNQPKNTDYIIHVSPLDGVEKVSKIYLNDVKFLADERVVKILGEIKPTALEYIKTSYMQMISEE